MYRKHSFEEKLNIVSQVKNGVPMAYLSRIYELDEKMVLEWVRKYDLHGEPGLERQPDKKVTAEIKERIVKEVMQKTIPLPLVALQYGISRSSLKSWVKTVKIQGYAGLYQQNKQGQRSTAMGRPKKRALKTELEQLQEENIRLKAENALLKKVKALVEEREARERMNGLKPSKN